jgi:hypothetical protein
VEKHEANSILCNTMFLKNRDVSWNHELSRCSEIKITPAIERHFEVTNGCGFHNEKIDNEA